MPSKSQNEFFQLTGLAREFENKTLKPSEITEFYLRRILENDASIKAFETTYADAAMRAAKAADYQIAEGNWLGPFHGIPFVLKDICDLEGHVTTCGSKLYKNRVANSTAIIASRLFSAGGILLGKSKTVEFAFGGWGTNQKMGTPRNPWDNQKYRICGGSSSGSAAALAGNMAVCAIGTDTGGSVRLPSAFCGLTGLKVTKGRVPTDGIMPLSHTLDTPGPMARSIADLMVMFEVLLGTKREEIQRSVKPFIDNDIHFMERLPKVRLGTINTRARRECSSQVLKHYDKVIKILESSGAIIETYEPIIDFSEISERISDIIAVEAYHHHGHLYEENSNPMDEDVRKRVLKVRNYTAYNYLNLLKKRKEAQKLFFNSIKGYDALLSPTTTSEAPLVSEVDQSISPGYFTRPINYYDMCAISIPMGLSKNKLPLGLQISARPCEELTALKIGAIIEQEIGSIF